VFDAHGTPFDVHSVVVALQDVTAEQDDASGVVPDVALSRLGELPQAFPSESATNAVHPPTSARKSRTARLNSAGFSK